jgi:tRNA(Ile2) C34 agmatinyltransferase TiaS
LTPPWPKEDTVPKCPNCGDDDGIISTARTFFCTMCGWSIDRAQAEPPLDRAAARRAEVAANVARIGQHVDAYIVPVDPQDANDCEACQ